MKQPKPKSKQSLMDNDDTHINSQIKEATERLTRISNIPDGVSGLRSGFKNLDKITFGWQAGDLVVISARPAMGKTAFITSMLLNMGVKEKYPVGIFSLELTNTQLTNRLISNICEIPGEKIMSGMLAEYEWAQLDYKIKELRNTPIYIECPHTLSIQSLCSKARKMVLDYGIKALFVDYLQLLTVTEKYTDNRYNEINYISRELKALAKELNITIFAVSQMNRGVESRTGADGKRPQLYDLRDSGTLCDDADMVCFIHRPEYYKILEDEKGYPLIGLAEFIIAKNRNGETADVRLRFKQYFCRMEEWEEDDLNFGGSSNSSPITIDPNSSVPF